MIKKLPKWTADNLWVFVCERGRVMYSYQSLQSSAAADKQKCEGQLRCRGLIDMAGAQRITDTHTHTHTRLYFAVFTCVNIHWCIGDTVCSKTSMTAVQENMYRPKCMMYQYNFKPSRYIFCFFFSFFPSRHETTDCKTKKPFFLIPLIILWLLISGAAGRVPRLRKKKKDKIQKQKENYILSLLSF